MNKRIRRIIAITLAVSAFSAFAPTKSFNLINNAAYASTYGVNHIQVNDGSSSTALQLYSSSSCDSDEKVNDFNLGTSKYYVETYENGINVDVDTDSGYYVKVSKTSSGTDGVGSGQRLHIADGDTVSVYVKIFDESTDKIVKTYTVSVKQLSKSSGSSHYYDDDDYDYGDAYLDDIKLSDGDISFSKSKSTYNVNVGSSVDEIRVTAEPENDDYAVKINGDVVDDNDDYKKTVPLNMGKNEITIRVRDDDNKLRTYTLYVYRGGSSSSNTSVGEEDDYQDNIFLDDLIFDNNAGEVNINFRPKVTTYNVNVSSTCDSVILKATPEDEDNIIRINGDKVNSKYARSVKLNEGKNVIEVRIDNSNDYERDDDDYKYRVYTLNVYRGGASGNTTTNTQNNSNTQTAAKINQWVSANGRWQYNGSDGVPVKNQWKQDGNGKWYYLDSDGFMQIGWLKLGPAWYYFNADGSMITGWIEYYGKYYYFDSNGVMQSNAKIGLYQLGPDGAWIG